MIAAEHQTRRALVTKLTHLTSSTIVQTFATAPRWSRTSVKFEALNRVRLTDSEFARLIDEIVTPDVFTAARTLRERNDFARDDGASSSSPSS